MVGLASEGTFHHLKQAVDFAARLVLVLALMQPDLEQCDVQIVLTLGKPGLQHIHPQLMDTSFVVIASS